MSSWAQRYSQWAVKKSAWTIALIGAVTLFFVAQLAFLQVNPSLFLLGKTFEGRVQMEKARHWFTGTGEPIYIAEETAQNSIINIESLKTIATLTRAFHTMSLIEEGDAARLKALAKDAPSQKWVTAILSDGITPADLQSLKEFQAYADQQAVFSSKEKLFLKDLMIRVSPVIKVISLSNIQNISASGNTLDIHDLMPAVPADEAQLQSLVKEVAANEMFKDALISRDGKAAMIQIELSINEEDTINLHKMYLKVKDILAKTKTSDTFHLGGGATYYAAIADIMQKDGNTFFPLIFVIMSMSLFFGMRSWQGVWIPLSVAFGSLLWTLGTVSLLGYRLNLITNMIPVFLISLATSDSVHLLTRYYLYSASQEKEQALRTALRQQLLPMTLSSICTFIGFAALAYTNLTFIFEFGVFVALGVIYALLITLVLLPSLIPFLKLPREINAVKNKSILFRIVTGAADIVESVTARHPRTLTLAAVLLFAGLMYHAAHIRVDNETVATFPKDSLVRKDVDNLNRNFGGTVPFSILIEGQADGMIKQPVVVNAMRLIQQRLKTHAEIGYTISPVNFLDRIHEVMTNQAHARLPLDASQDLISQYLLLYEFSDGNDIKTLVDFNYRNARIIAFSKDDTGSVLLKTIRDVEAYAKTVLPAGTQVHVAGLGELAADTIPEIINDQIKSFVVSSVIISLIMIVLLRSVALGLIAMVPIFMSVAILGALMVTLNIQLDIGTSMICGICFGVGIDYAIYYTSIYQQYMAEFNGDYERALGHTMHRVAYPIFVNASSLGFGFLVLCLSGYAVIMHLGLLVACSQFVSIACTLFLLPLLIRAFRPKFRTGTVNAATDAA